MRSLLDGFFTEGDCTAFADKLYGEIERAIPLEVANQLLREWVQEQCKVYGQLGPTGTPCHKWVRKKWNTRKLIQRGEAFLVEIRKLELLTRGER